MSEIKHFQNLLSYDEGRFVPEAEIVQGFLEGLDEYYAWLDNKYKQGQYETE